MVPRFVFGPWITDFNFEYFPGTPEARQAAVQRYNQSYLMNEVSRMRSHRIPFDTTSRNRHQLCITSVIARSRGSSMNWDQVKGNWKQFTGKVREKWGKLTDDDLTVIAGKRDQLAGILQERYGIEKAKAEAEIDAFEKSLKM